MDSLPEETGSPDVSGQPDARHATTRRSHGAQPSDGQPSPTRTMGTRTIKAVYSDFPSVKYPDVDIPASKANLRRAVSPPKPTLPRRANTRSWNATAKERNPLAACLTGPGRAGKYGELVTEKGGRYEGEVLAGRPHGVGQYFVRTTNRLNPDPWTLEYEGAWIQGMREGHGIRYYPSGETYDGDFASGVRHGHGRYNFTNGDVYAGEWVDDRRTGHGTYFYANGDVFVGNFINDRKEGKGTLYMMARQRKYVAEYVHNQPKCGTVLNIEDEDLEPLRGQLRTMSLTSKLDLATTGKVPNPLPDLEVAQPNKVLAAEVVSVRKARAEGGRDMRLVQAHSGTLSSKEIEMLRHSFTLMAAGDGPKNGLLPHQLRELIVMAGLDPAVPATRQLVDKLLAQRDMAPASAHHQRISFDNFMKVVINFQEESTQVQMVGQDQQQQQWEEGQEQVGDWQQQQQEGSYAEGEYANPDEEENERQQRQAQAEWTEGGDGGEEVVEVEGAEGEQVQGGGQEQAPGEEQQGAGEWAEQEQQEGEAAVPDAGYAEVAEVAAEATGATAAEGAEAVGEVEQGGEEEQAGPQEAVENDF